MRAVHRRFLDSEVVMLYREDIEGCCEYCRYSRPMGDGEAVCERRGIVSVSGCCRRFRYDPLRRIPERPAVVASRTYTEEEFAL